MRTATVTILLLLSALPCRSALRSDVVAQRADRTEARVLGIINEDAANAIVAPETVRAGEDFEVKITTTGGGCERAGDTGVLLAENSATVMVYDFTAATRPGVACTMIFKQITHTATLRLTKTGAAVIRVWGRRLSADTPPGGAPIVLERRVTVK